MITRRLFTAAAAAAALPFPMAARASSYPQQSVRAVVVNAPGTGTDTTTRFVANHMSKAWNSAVVVENKVGAGGTIGTEFVAKSAPDGYNILFTTGAHYSFPVLYEQLSFNTVADFTPVANIAQSAIAVFVPADSPFKTIGDVFAAARKNPGGVSYTTPGAGTSSHLAAALMNSMAGISMQHVPYKSASQAVLEVANGQAPVGVNGIVSILPLLRGGKVRALAVTSQKRSQLLPEVPTLDEAGLKGYEFVVPILALVRAGTPEPIVKTIGAAVTAAAATPEFRALCQAQGLDVKILGPAEMHAEMPKEFAKWKRVAELAGAREQR